jgi:hypothetical protein
MCTARSISLRAAKESTGEVGTVRTDQDSSVSFPRFSQASARERRVSGDGGFPRDLPIYSGRIYYQLITLSLSGRLIGRQRKQWHLLRTRTVYIHHPWIS